MRTSRPRWLTTIAFVAILLAVSIPMMLSPRYLAADQTGGRPAFVEFSFDPQPITIGKEVTFVWEVRRADSISILPLGEDLDPELERYTFVASWEVFEGFKVVASNQHGNATITLRPFPGASNRPTDTP